MFPRSNCKYLPLLFALCCGLASAQDKAELRLDDVVRDVLAANPSVSRAQHLTEASQRRVQPAGALPDPNVTVSWMGSAVPFRVMDNDPSSYRGLTVMQMLPLGGKRELRREVERREGLVTEADAQIVSRNIVEQARMAFFDYYYTTKALEVTATTKIRLQQLADVTEARYRVGKAMQQDVLKARLEVSSVMQSAAMLEQQRQAAIARLNSLMARDVLAPLPAPAEPVRTALPALENLLPDAEKSDPMLLKEQRMGDREKAALALTRKEFLPDLSVGYMYQQRAGMADMHGAAFTVNLPIFQREKQKNQLAEGKLRIEAAAEAAQSRRLELQYELRKAYADALSAQQTINLYDEAVLPQAELARESAQASYDVGNVDFLTVVSSYTAILNYRLDYYRQLANYQTALARIQTLTGTLGQRTETEAH